MSVTITHNDRTSLSPFAELNRVWIEKMFTMEASDNFMVEHPEYFVENGNHMFAAKLNDDVVGAVALKKVGEKYELTKMVVDPKAQGNGVGALLLQTAHEFARDQLKLQSIYLMSNTQCAAAIRMYKRHGWIVTHEGPHPLYARANIVMEKHLVS